MPIAVQDIYDTFGDLTDLGDLWFACDSKSAATCNEITAFSEWMTARYSRFGDFFKGTFDSEETAMNYVTEENRETWGVVVFHTFEPLSGVVDYSIRLNWTRGIPLPLMFCNL